MRSDETCTELVRIQQIRKGGGSGLEPDWRAPDALPPFFQGDWTRHDDMTMHTMRAALEAAGDEARDYLAAHGYLPADGASANDLFLLTDDLANRFFEARERDARFRETLRSYALKPQQINELASCANERVAPNVRAAYVFGLAVGLHLRYLRGQQP